MIRARTPGTAGLARAAVLAVGVSAAADVLVTVGDVSDTTAMFRARGVAAGPVTLTVTGGPDGAVTRRSLPATEAADLTVRSRLTGLTARGLRPRHPAIPQPELGPRRAGQDHAGRRAARLAARAPPGVGCRLEGGGEVAGLRFHELLAGPLAAGLKAPRPPETGLGERSSDGAPGPWRPSSVRVGQIRDAERADQPEQRGALDLERGRRPAAVAGVRRQRLADQRALERAHGLLQGEFTKLPSHGAFGAGEWRARYRSIDFVEGYGARRGAAPVKNRASVRLVSRA